jgi:GntR family transcriptional regulator
MNIAMLHLLDVDTSSATPIWRQIEDGVRRQVASGRLPAGSAVPSVRELARALRVNPATVSKAYRRLTDAGLLTVRRGEGTFVADLPAGDRSEERLRLLAEGAAVFAGVARAIGAGRREALQAVGRAWDDLEDEGGEGAGDDD